MTLNKYFRYIFITIIAMSLLSVFTTNISQNQSYKSKIDITINTLQENFQPLFVISQDDNTTTATNTTTTTTQTTTSTPENDTRTRVPWTPIISEGLYYPLALIFSALGIFSTLWLIFFVETSKERTIRERIIGSAIRLVIMSIFVALAIHFWLLFEPI